ncbi:MAG: amidase [Fimbriimonas sp.]
MAADLPLSRKELLTATLASLAATGLAQSSGQPGPAVPPAEITVEDLKAVERIAGLEFTDEERKAALAEIRSARTGFLRLRETPIAFTTDPMTVFTPIGGGSRPGRVRTRSAVAKVQRPAKAEDLAFMNLRELGQLLRTRQVTSVELTRLYLDRLKRQGDRLLCVVTLTENLALRQAERADRELREGKDRGPLHGIPYGIKDLFATKEIPTTWGAEPYKDQVFGFDAAVVERLEKAGAVLVAKLSMGALAMGDVWFRGTTKNPWNLSQGSSGSSAGSASALAAGLVPFAIGTETYGSITSPSLRCRVTGFRPSYGRISRYGAMELSYTMDKVGPIARDAEDCALVFAALCGADPRDPSAVDRPFEFPRRVDMKRLKVGYLGNEEALGKDPAALALREMGATVTPKEFTPTPNGLFAILEVESASAFEEFTRNGKIRGLKNSSWPETFRGARYVPAVEYLQAQRARTVSMRRFEDELGDLDLLLGQGLGSTISHTNFGGHPQILLPWGDDGKGNSVGRSLIGRLYRDDQLLTVAKTLQERFDYHRRRPNGF